MKRWRAAQGDAALRVVVGFPPAGSADTIARLLADQLKDELKRPVVVENRPGAGPKTLAGFLKLAKADPKRADFGSPAAGSAMRFYAMYAPAGTPAAAVAQSNAALRRVLQLPDLRDRLSALALTPRAGSPEELQRSARDDAAVWGPVIKASGFVVD